MPAWSSHPTPGVGSNPLLPQAGQDREPVLNFESDLALCQTCRRTAPWGGGGSEADQGRHRTSPTVGAQETGRVAVVAVFSCTRQSWRGARQETETQAKRGQRPDSDMRGFPLRFLGNQ